MIFDSVVVRTLSWISWIQNQFKDISATQKISIARTFPSSSSLQYYAIFKWLIYSRKFSFLWKACSNKAMKIVMKKNLHKEWWFLIFLLFLCQFSSFFYFSQLLTFLCSPFFTEKIWFHIMRFSYFIRWS